MPALDIEWEERDGVLIGRLYPPGDQKIELGADLLEMGLDLSEARDILTYALTRQMAKL